MLFGKRKHKMQYDFEVCTSWVKVEAVLDEINRTVMPLSVLPMTRLAGRCSLGGL